MQQPAFFIDCSSSFRYLCVAMVFNLERFIEAQNSHGAFQTALSEIRAGEKRSHWIWFVFPQVDGLGFSDMSHYYGIKSVLEAKAFLDDSILGARLKEITMALLDHKDRSAEDVFGYVDAMKVKSSMTLFDLIQPFHLWGEVLRTFYSDSRCQKTIELTLSEVAKFDVDIPAKHDCPIQDYEFFDRSKPISIRARCVWLLKLMSQGESVTDILKCYLWKTPITDSVLSDSATTLYYCMSDLFSLCAFRYAEEKDKELFRGLSDKLVQMDPFEMAKEFDDVYLKYCQNQGFISSVGRYIDSY